MPTSVEEAIYQVPSADYGYYLRNSYNFRRDVTQGGYGNGIKDYSSLPTLALEIGLRRAKMNVSTQHGAWHIYQGANLAIPNFPDGDTRVNEALALYERDGNLTNAILRIQPGHKREPFAIADLVDDLDAFTKYYIERPRLWGFPSEVLTRTKTHMIIFGVSIPVGGAVGFIASGGDTTAASFGALVGEVVPASITASLWGLAEMRARRKIPHKDEYMSGDHATEALIQQKDHIVQTSIQRELYSALQRVNTTLTPEQFLDNIYPQMPPSLIDRREEEIERAKYPEQFTDKIGEEALPKMVKVAQILQTAA